MSKLIIEKHPKLRIVLQQNFQSQLGKKIALTQAEIAKKVVTKY
jgi:hypothetical protein